MQPGEQEHHAERCEKVRDAQADDKQPIDEADRGAAVRANATVAAAPNCQHDHRVARQHQGEGRDRADGEIEAIHRERNRDANREQSDDGDRLKHAEQIVDAQERRFGGLKNTTSAARMMKIA